MLILSLLSDEGAGDGSFVSLMTIIESVSVSLCSFVRDSTIGNKLLVLFTDDSSSSLSPNSNTHSSKGSVSFFGGGWRIAD